MSSEMLRTNGENVLGSPLAGFGCVAADEPLNVFYRILSPGSSATEPLIALCFLVTIVRARQVRHNRGTIRAFLSNAYRLNSIAGRDDAVLVTPATI